ncbi:penicillin-binding protein 2 [bacterium]|nr:penicillin-binding protein 2 [bacterium]
MVFLQTIRANWRINLLLGFFGACLLIVIGKLIQVQILQHDEFLRKANSQQSRKYEIAAKRGEIYTEENGERYPLALNQRLSYVFADPKFITEPQKVANQLAPILEKNPAELTPSLTFNGSRYIVLKERVSDEKAQQIKDLKIPGIVLKAKDYRYYTEGNLFSQVLGYVNNDGEGQYGLEQFYDRELTGENGLLKAVTDSQGVPIYGSDNTQIAPKDGSSVVLTLDRSIQSIARKALEQAVTQNRAESGSLVVMDPNSGAIQAMVNYPDYDPNNYQNVKSENYGVFQNAAVSSLYEPGSIFKPITMSAGIDSGKVKADTKYTDTGEVTVSGKTIRNSSNRRLGVQTMADVIQQSLNTGMVYVLMAMGGDLGKVTRSGKELLYSYVTKFGFGKVTGIEQAGEVASKIKDPSTYDVDYASMMFGQGITVTVMQMMQAVSAIANGGKLYQPHLVAKVIDRDGKVNEVKPRIVNDRVISQQTAAVIANMMISVVQKGSGFATRMKGYNIAGKTGTASVPKADGTGYEENKNIGSFIGFAPVENPRFVMMVRINYPKVDGFAERTAVPAFAEVAKELFKYYQIPPSS